MSRIVDEALLEEVRRMPCCWCGRRGPSEAAHVFARGHGGGFRLDVRINLVPLCRLDHQSHHDGNGPSKKELLAIVARREGTTAKAAEQEIYRLMRLPKGAK